MASYPRAFSCWSLVVSVLAVAGCADDGTDGKNGTDGRDGSSWLTAAVPADPVDCPSGGTSLQVGPDTDADGLLDASEVSSTAVVCNGDDGDATAVWLTAAEDADPATCPWGGTVLHFGKDRDGSEVLEPGEYLSSRSVCGTPIAPSTVATNWTGLGDDALWSNGANWDRGTPPSPGESVVFSTTAARLQSFNDLPRLFAVNDLFVGGGHTISGNQLTVLGSVASGGVGGTVTVGLPLFMRGDGISAFDVPGVDVDLVISGSIDGPPPYQLNKEGSGTVALSGRNIYTGSTVVVEGRLIAQGGDALPDGQGLACLSGVIEISAAGETIANLNMSCTLRLVGDFVHVQTGFLAELSGPMEGSGTYIKRGPGDFRLTGTGATYTGTLRVEEGALLVDGDYGGVPVVVEPGARLGGQGTVGAAELRAGATLSPGASLPAILTASADVTLTPGATFRALLIGTTAGSGYPRLASLGVVDLADATLDLEVDFTPAAGDTFTIVQASGGLTGTFAGLADGAILSSDGFSFTVDYTPSSVVLTRLP